MRLAVPAAAAWADTRLRLLHIGRDWEEGRAHAALLSRQERERAERFRFAEDARRFVLGRAAVRRLLSEAVGAAPSELALMDGGNRKPFCPQAGGWSFNVSHSGDLVLVGMARRGGIGVDVEARSGAPGDGPGDGIGSGTAFALPVPSGYVKERSRDSL
jgi:Phosphopantetheinyl transferase